MLYIDVYQEKRKCFHVQSLHLLHSNLVPFQTVSQTAHSRIPVIHIVVIPWFPGPRIRTLGHLSRVGLDIRAVKRRGGHGLLLLCVGDDGHNAGVSVIALVPDEANVEARCGV